MVYNQLHERLAKMDTEQRQVFLKDFPTDLAKAGDYEGLRQLLTNFEFLQLKVETFGSYPLLEDYNLVHDKDELLELFHQVLDAESYILNDKPFLFCQQFYNKLFWNADEKLRRSLHELTQKSCRTWLKRLNLPAAFIKTPVLRTLVNNECANISVLQWHAGTKQFPNGVVAAGYEDGTLRLWNLANGNVQHGFQLDKSKVLAVGFNGSKLCAFTTESLLAVFELTTGQLLHTRQFEPETSICAAFSLPTDDEDILPSLAFYTQQKDLIVVRFDEDLQIIYHENDGEIHAITFLGYQEKLVLTGKTNQKSEQYTGGGDYSPRSLVKVLSLEGFEEVVNTAPKFGFSACCHGYIKSVSATPDGECFATASYMPAIDEYSEYELVYLGKAAVWQKQKGVWEPNYRTSSGVGFFAIAFCPEQQQTVGIEWGKGLTLWDNDGKRIETMKLTADRQCRSLIVSSDKKASVFVGVGSAIHCIALDDIANPRPIHDAFHHHYEVKTADISPDLSLIATGSIDFKIAIQEVRPGKMARLLWQGEHRERVNSVVFSPDGQKVYSGGYDWQIKCWHARTGERLDGFSSESGRIGTLGICPTGDRLFAFNADGNGFWVLDHELEPLIAHVPMKVPWLFVPHAFSPTNHIAIALESSNEIALINIPELLDMLPDYLDADYLDEEQRTFSAIRRIHGIPNISALCFSHQSELLAIGNSSTVSVRHIQAEQVLHTWKYNNVRTLAFSIDDRFLACGTDNEIAILSLKSGKEISWLPTTSPIISLRFSADGKKLAAVDDGSHSGHQPEIYLFQFEAYKTDL
jgi:WD40 repeat protein